MPDLRLLQKDLDEELEKERLLKEELRYVSICFLFFNCMLFLDFNLLEMMYLIFKLASTH